MGSLRNALRLVDAHADVTAALDTQHGPRVGGRRPGVLGALPTGVLTLPDGAAVDRTLAMSVPALRQGVLTISGTCGSLPFRLTRNRQPLQPWGVITQPDPDEPPSVTWTRVVEDLVLHPYAWLRVTDRYRADSDTPGFPRTAVYVPFEDVSLEPETGRVYVDGADVTRDMLRFDSPTAPGVLVAGARTIATSLLVEDAVRRYARMEIPAGALKQTGGAPLSDEQIDSLLERWDTQRANRMTGFLNESVEYEQFSWNPSALQLVEARAALAQDFARLLNLPPVAVNAESGSSLTYSTSETQGRSLLNVTLTPYLSALTGRLSMPDVTPRGQSVSPDLDAFLRADAAGRAAVYSSALADGWMTVDEVRAREGLPPLEGNA